MLVVLGYSEGALIQTGTTGAFTKYGSLQRHVLQYGGNVLRAKEYIFIIFIPEWEGEIALCVFVLPSNEVCVCDFIGCHNVRWIQRNEIERDLRNGYITCNVM